MQTHQQDLVMLGKVTLSPDIFMFVHTKLASCFVFFSLIVVRILQKITCIIFYTSYANDVKCLILCSTFKY